MSTTPPIRPLVTPAATGAENMALDEALMLRARESGEWVLRVYAWRRPTVSFGRNQRARDAYPATRLRDEGLDVVRRPTGGRAILHHREVTYSVTGPADSAGTLHTSYERINDILLDGLASLGVHARRATDPRVGPPGAMPCFAEPAPGELEVDGRKLVGSAQWRNEGAFLQHGSILIEDDQHRLLGISGGATALPVATLRECLGRAPSLEAVAEALIGAAYRATGEAPPLSETELLAVSRRASALVAHYADAAWTWRR